MSAKFMNEPRTAIPLPAQIRLSAILQKRPLASESQAHADIRDAESLQPRANKVELAYGLIPHFP